MPTPDLGDVTVWMSLFKLVYSLLLGILFSRVGNQFMRAFMISGSPVHFCNPKYERRTD